MPDRDLRRYGGSFDAGGRRVAGSPYVSHRGGWKAPRCYMTWGSVADLRTRRDEGGIEQMTATTYYATTADEQLAEAQRTLDMHITSSADGRCLRCGTPGPCRKRERAVVVFSRTLRLPRRQPGATRPESIGAKDAAFNWLGTGRMERRP
jgi:hypothetical protein